MSKAPIDDPFTWLGFWMIGLVLFGRKYNALRIRLACASLCALPGLLLLHKYSHSWLLSIGVAALLFLVVIIATDRRIPFIYKL